MAFSLPSSFCRGACFVGARCARPAAASSAFACSETARAARPYSIEASFLISQRLAGLEQVLDAGESRGRFQKLHEAGALEREHLVFGHHLGDVGVAAGDDARDLARDDGVVRQRLSLQAEALDREIERG